MNPHLARRLLGLLAGALLSGGAAPAAHAFTATLITNAHLRAGPSIEYPIVTPMPVGAAVEVFGCEENYGWCDVQLGPDRGWVDAAYLQMGSPGGDVIVASGGVMLGLPIVAFSFGTYWDRWYRGRPWYSRRPYYYDYWRRYPHGRPPPPPYRPIGRPPVRPPPVVRPPVRPPAVRPPRPGPPGVIRPPLERPPDAERPNRPGGRPPGGKPPGIIRPDSGRPPQPRPAPGANPQ